jgi:hypothetical protein
MPLFTSTGNYADGTEVEIVIRGVVAASPPHTVFNQSLSGKVCGRLTQVTYEIKKTGPEFEVGEYYVSARGTAMLKTEEGWLIADRDCSSQVITDAWSMRPIRKLSEALRG